MSIASEIERLQTAKASLKTSIEAKGVTVPQDATLEDYPALVDSISGGGGTLTLPITDAFSYYNQGAWSESFYNACAEGKIVFEITGDSSAYMFRGFLGTVLPKVTGTSNVTNMQSMFYEARKGPDRDTLDFSQILDENFDTSNVTNMRSMFNCAQDDTRFVLDLSHFDVSKVTNMYRMFYGRQRLAVLDISSFDFSGVTNFQDMFYQTGGASYVDDGAYAYGIPYVYVKDATAQNWVLTASNGHPSTWSTNNVVIKSQLNQG